MAKHSGSARGIICYIDLPPASRGKRATNPKTEPPGPFSNEISNRSYYNFCGSVKDENKLARDVLLGEGGLDKEKQRLVLLVFGIDLLFVCLPQD